MLLNDNPIIVDVNARKRNKKQNVFCVLCNKVQLECFNTEERRYRCPRCKNDYSLYYDIIPQEDILESSHEEESDFDDGVGLLSATNEDEFNDSENSDSKDSIPIPKYF